MQTTFDVMLGRFIPQTSPLLIERFGKTWNVIAKYYSYGVDSYILENDESYCFDIYDSDSSICVDNLQRNPLLGYLQKKYDTLSYNDLIIEFSQRYLNLLNK